MLGVDCGSELRLLEGFEVLGLTAGLCLEDLGVTMSSCLPEDAIIVALDVRSWRFCRQSLVMAKRSHIRELKTAAVAVR